MFDFYFYIFVSVNEGLDVEKGPHKDIFCLSVNFPGYVYFDLVLVFRG